MSIRNDIRSLFVLRPSPVRWPIALQASLAIGIPAVGFALFGRADLGLLASSGGFTALYLAGRSRRERAALLPLVAAGLIAACAIGVITSGSLLLNLTALFLTAVIAAVLCLGFSVGPPGVLFFVLVGGVSSHLAAPEALGGANLDGALVVGLLVLGCAVAYLVILAPLLVPGHRIRDAAVHSTRVQMRFLLDGSARVILIRIVIASAIALLISAPLGIHRAYWVLMTVVAILQNGHRVRLTALRAVHRVAGTVLGVFLFALVMVVNPTGVWVALLVMVLQFAVEMVVIRNYGLALVLITPLALTIASQARAGSLESLVVDRVADTLLGAAAALAVLLASLGLRRFRRLRNSRPA